MPTVALAALLRAKPSGPFWARQWLEDVLSRHLGGFATSGVHGWGVGTTVGNETLVQSRPIVREPDGRFLDDLLGAGTPCTLAAFFAGTRADIGRPPPVSVSRFQRWVGVVSERDLAATGATNGAAERLAATLPDFLARARIDRNERELLFFAFLAELHRGGALGNTYAAPERIRAALTTVAEQIAGKLNMFVYDGRTVGVVHQSGTLLTFEPPPPPDRSPRRVRDGETPAHANLMVLLPGDPPPTPIAGAERIAEGVFTILPGRPRTIVRD